MFSKILEKSSNKNIATAVLNPIDEYSLGGALEAAKLKIIKPILLGSKALIEATAAKHNLNLSDATIIDCKDDSEILSKTLELYNSKSIFMIMKGNIHTDSILSMLLKKDNGFRIEGRQVNHVAALAMPTYHKILFMADVAISIVPTLEQKIKILHNSIAVLNKLGIEKPKVAVLSSIEYVNPKLNSSVEASLVASDKELRQKAIIEGPLAFDNAISKKSAEIKNIKSEVAGDVDLLLLPNLDAGNILFKSLINLANASFAGIIVGLTIPVILTSRADTVNSRVLSAAFAVSTI